jgi:predicted ATP-grasp superfamily ATP-dependent carboligase
MKKLIGISREAIKRNNDKRQNNQAVVKVSYVNGTFETGSQVIIYDENGKECARVVYSRDRQQKGMNAWIETENEVKVL